MTENLTYFSLFEGKNESTTKMHSHSNGASHVLHQQLFESDDTFTHVFLPQNEPHKYSTKKLMAKEETITEARKIIRQEKFQHLRKEKQERVINHELIQVRENLENGRLLRNIQLKDIEEIAEIKRKHRASKKITPKLSSNNATLPQWLSRYKNECFDDSNETKKQTSRKFDGIKKISGKNLETQPLKLRHKFRKESNCIKKEDDSDLAESETKLRNIAVESNFTNLTPRFDNEKNTFHQDECNLQETLEREKKSRDFSRRVKLIKKYFEYRLTKNFFVKWKEYTARKKCERHDQRIWQDKIDTFMKRLNFSSTKETKITLDSKPQATKVLRTKTAPTLTNHNSLKPPGEEEVKLQNISRATTKSASETRQKLDSKSVLRLDPSLRGRAKLIRVFTAVINTEDKSDNQKFLKFPEPTFLLEMDRKQKERKQRLKELREKQRFIEEEKIKEAKLKLERQLRHEEEEKRRKIEEFREKVRKERVEQERRKEEWLQLKSMTNKAEQYYKHKLLTKYGLDPWLRMVELRRNQSVTAEQQNDKRLKRQFLAIWKSCVDDIIEEKKEIAYAFWRKKNLKYFLMCWQEVLTQKKIKIQVAEDWSDYLTVRKALTKWQTFVFIEQFENEQKWKKAEEHFKRKEKTKYLKHWMLLPQVLYLEREKEQRKQEWRKKIQQVLPDFRPIPAKEY